MKQPARTRRKPAQGGMAPDERQQLRRQILQIAEQEKASIGHHLHDGIGQTLTGVTSLVEALESELSGTQRASASRIRELLQGALQEVRRMSHGLSPLTMKNRSLGDALSELAETISRSHRVACVCTVEPGIQINDEEKKTHIYRIAQEASSNAIRHGNPKNITISLRRLADKECELKIEDDGKGFSKGKAGDGIGLQVMEYRASLIGGTLEIESKPGRGVCVTCRFR